MRSSVVQIEGEEYTFVKERMQMPVSIYKGRNSYLRIGPKALIEKEIQYHKNLIEFGFPVPEILSEGTSKDLYYYTESSCGDVHFGDIFSTNCLSDLTIRDADFSKLLEVVIKFVHAQLQTVDVQPCTFNNFKELIHVDILLEELPQLRTSVLEASKKVEERVRNIPSVLTHGDFNPHNIFEEGVIDWEAGSYAPLGYDLVCNIYTIFFFPLQGDYEFTAGCRYSERQIQNYWQEMNAICASAGISKISEYIHDFIFCRSVWSTVRMQSAPKLQEWRYGHFEALLEAYLHNHDLSKFLQNY